MSDKKNVILDIKEKNLKKKQKIINLLRDELSNYKEIDKVLVKNSDDKITDLNNIYITDDELVDYINELLKRDRFIYDYEAEIIVEAFADSADCWWITAFGKYANTLIRVEKKTLEMEIIPFPYVVVKKYSGFFDIHVYENYVFLIPNASTHLVIYNIISKEWEYLGVPCDSEKNKYYGGIVINDIFYMLPSKNKYIMSYNIKDKTIGVLNSINKTNLNRDSNSSFFVSGSVYNNYCFYFYSRAYNAILNFEYNNKKIIVEHKFSSEVSNTAVLGNNFIYLISVNVTINICVYDLNKKEIKEYKYEKIEDGNIFYSCGIIDGEDIIWFPGQGR